jgi:hypothetical protein
MSSLKLFSFHKKTEGSAILEMLTAIFLGIDFYKHIGIK